MPPLPLLLLLLFSPPPSAGAAVAAEEPPLPIMTTTVLIASSELTLRTTASVDIQVCVGGVLSDERAVVQAGVLEALRFALMRTTAVYPVRRYTTSAGTVCFLFVYQAPSPDDAALTEALIRAADAGRASSPSTNTNTETDAAAAAAAAELTLTVDIDSRRQLQCAVTAIVWQGEDPPLPLWGASATDLVLWGGIAGGVLLACLLSACCFAALSRSEDERRARALLDTDRAVLRRLLHLRAAASVAAKKPKKSVPPVSFLWRGPVCGGVRHR